MMDFLRKLLTGSSKVICQKADNEFETGAFFMPTAEENADKNITLLFIGLKIWVPAKRDVFHGGIL